MERITRCLKGRNLRKGVSCLLMWFLIISMWGPVVMALESGNVISSDGIIGTPTWGDDTIIDTDHGAIINWNNFDTSSTQSVTFNQYKSGELSDLSAVLNRISSGAVPTQFSGALNANGRVFIVNPAGIVFGAGSQIDVTQLVASGLNMEDGAFQAVLDDPANNKMEFSGGNGDILSRATIQADSVYLIGTRVFNLGPILAPNGLVVLAAGEEVRLYEDGSDVSVVVSDVGDGIPDVRNSNIVSAANGKIVLAAGDTFSRAVTNVGILAASGGEISIQAAQINNNGIIRVSGSGDGGSVNLKGTDLVSVGVDGLGTAGSIEANAGDNGNGGTVTIQTDGLFRVGEDSTITASGGSVSGNGGTVSVTCDDFEIAGEISASPGNKTYETGKLEITTPSVIIADGANAAATDTLYEEDIEALSQSGTSIILNAAESITVQDITDNEITGQFGDFQLLAAKDSLTSSVSFDDTSDTLRTTLGDIIISAGGGGINVGNLTTGKDLTDEKPTPGMIFLTSGTTEVSGDITTGSLTVRGGWGTGKIDVKSSGNLTVNGDVIVGSESDILNVADEKAAEALVTLRADKDVKLNGIVEAHANGIEEDASVTKAYINIIAGDNANINGDLFAEATSSSSGTADAIVSVESVGDIFFAEGVDAHAKANTTEVQGIVSDEEPENPDPSVDHAQIIINNSAIVLVDDIGIFSTPKSGADVVLDVLANDILEGDVTIDDSSIDPADGSLTIGTVGDKTVLLYNPPEDLSGKFDENGEFTVTFTYTVAGRTANGDITLTNGLPVAVDDLATTIQNKSINIDVLLNDTDPDQGDILSVIEGAIKTKNGTLVMNEDGTFTYTPNDGFLGTDSFTYAVTDGFNESAEVVVKITVNDVPKNIPPTPGLDRIEWINVEVSGYPALANWVAKELGVDAKTLEIQVASSPASTTGIQPYESYSKLFKAAKILQDADGTHIAALAQVVNEFASSTAPPTEEQIIAIADAIARNRDEDSHYAVADEYLEALTTYVGILTDEMGFSPTESVQLVTDKYVSRLAQGQNVGVAAFIAASLAALGG